MRFFKPKYGELLVDADDCLDKVVIVDATDKVREEVLPDVVIHGGEEELEQVQYAGPEVSPAEGKLQKTKTKKW